MRAALVPALLAVYIDVEYTERGNQFYEKFSSRFSIAQLLAWLWDVPQHRATWRRIGAGPFLCTALRELQTWMRSM